MRISDALPIVANHISFGYMEKVVATMQETGIRTLFIDSAGGSMESFIFSKRRLLNKTNFVGGQRVHSVAIPIFLCGKERVCLTETTFLFHFGGLELEGRTVKQGEAQMLSLQEECFPIMINGKNPRKIFWENVHRNLSFFDDLYASFVAQRTGMNARRVKSMMYEEVLLNACEAKKYGLVHRIIDADDVSFSL